MSSPSPGKRRMDTDVVKLYPFSNINNTTGHPYWMSCFLFYFDSFKEVSAHVDAWCLFLMAAGSVSTLG